MKKISIIALLFLILNWFSYWSFWTLNQRDIGGWLSSVYENAKDSAEASKRMKDLSSPMEWDLYKQAFQMLAEMDIWTNKKSIDIIVNYYKKEWKVMCSQINKDDIISILDEKADLWDACKKVLSCESGEDLSEKPIWYNKLNQCKVSVQNKLNNISASLSDVDSFKVDSFGEDMFMNWNLDDSPYDLLADIEAIADIMFKDNEETETTVLFSIWDDAKDHSSALWWLPWSWWWFPRGSIEEDKESEKSEGDKENEENNNSNNSLFWWENLACSEEFSEDEESENDKDEDYVEWIIANNPDLAAIAWWNNASDEDILNAVKDCGWSWNKACMRQHLCWRSDIWNTDYWEIYLTYCLETVETSSIAENKPVESIEWMLMEINNVLTSLDESWELVKHTKTSDSMDSQLKNVDFWRAFSFDFVLMNKPTFSDTSEKQEEFEIQNELDRMNRQLLWTYPSTSHDKERNKYTMIYDKNTTQAKRRNAPGWSNQQIANIAKAKEQSELWLSWYQEKTDELKQIIKSSNNENKVELLEDIEDFIINNNDFWVSSVDSLENINQISNYLNNKIQATAK